MRSGATILSRYDISPTSNAPAVCRARIGVGHWSSVVSLVASQEGLPSSETRGWLASRGCSGDVLVWRTDVTAGAREPIAIAARLAGPHTAVAFAPRGLASSTKDIFGLFAMDAAFGALRLFAVHMQRGWRNRNAMQCVDTAEMVSACMDPRTMDKTVKQLFALPLPPKTVHLDAESACVIFGIGGGGHVRAWHVYRARSTGVEIAHVKLVINGRRMGRATAAGTCIEGGTGDALLVVGGNDGCMRVYKVSEKHKPTDSFVYNANSSAETKSNALVKDGEIHLDEIAFLGERDGSEAPVCEVQVSAGGTRIVSTRDDGSIVVWERSFASGAGWTIELSCGGVSADKIPVARRNSVLLSRADADQNVCVKAEPGVESCPIGVSTGHDRDGDLCLITSRPNGVFEVFQKPLGTAWECSGSFQSVVRDMSITKSAIVHIGPGYVVATSGRGLTVYRANFSGKRTISFGADAAGYSPSRGLMALLLLVEECNKL